MRGRPVTIARPVSDAFFLPLGDGHFEATAHTSGPWGEGLQHAGPPAALLARTLERCEPRPEMVVSRVTSEILHAVPVGELEASARIVRPGRSVELLEATLSAGGREVMRASAWRVLRSPADGPEARVDYELPPLPDDEGPLPDQLASPYVRSIEWRPIVLEPGRAVVWTRLRGAVVAGEEPTGLQRLMAVADSGNGVSASLNMSEWWFINPELTVHLTRDPHGEWICLDAATTIEPGGAGLATSVLSDLEGPVARGAQTLYVAPRSG